METDAASLFLLALAVCQTGCAVIQVRLSWQALSWQNERPQETRDLPEAQS
jgi:hypothetical protein